MKRFIICALLIASGLSLQGIAVPGTKAEAYSTSYTWSKVWKYGEAEWILYYGGQQVYGWQQVNGVWYYIYPSTGYMAHDTFVNGYYVNSDGAWTKDIPNTLQKIIEAVPNPEWIFDCGSTFEAEISFLPNQNLKELTKLGWNAPNVNGTVVCIDFSEYFVADDGTVFKAPHQAYDTIYQYNKDGTVKEYPYK
ncbi:MAG TPA: hypothetical protein DG753_03260 [Clostridium sp.]|nr:hypothetical protein [Clostridium sp.]